MFEIIHQAIHRILVSVATTALVALVLIGIVFGLVNLFYTVKTFINTHK